MTGRRRRKLDMDFVSAHAAEAAVGLGLALRRQGDARMISINLIRARKVKSAGAGEAGGHGPAGAGGGRRWCSPPQRQRRGRSRHPRDNDALRADIERMKGELGDYEKVKASSARPAEAAEDHPGAEGGAHRAAVRHARAVGDPDRRARAPASTAPATRNGCAAIPTSASTPAGTRGASGWRASRRRSARCASRARRAPTRTSPNF